MGEIVIQYEELRTQLSKLDTLNSETGYKIYSTSEFINLCRGEMFEAVNEVYVTLENIEAAFLQTVTKTIDALNVAGYSFSVVEQQITDIVDFVE